MTLQASPEPASASWRVLVALRLLHLKVPSLSISNESVAGALKPWFDVVNGAAELVSDENEELVYGTIKALCEAVQLQAQEGEIRCATVKNDWGDSVQGDTQASLQMLFEMFRNEKKIAEDVFRNAIP